ncbi:Short-chain dehydrogenase/reductase SDR [Macrophomina phaseolina MS6]|uniref:Short-chain dehydrogenase/reductase SDR n=1 Tax=Macrophomina phaseolina (strain MS6) TaxID=1126212 RepID=K2SBB4_MACPH|nr:Short-chain dehydrogenase/reductase SDR [Macrophomina phaseolina MS6]
MFQRAKNIIAQSAFIANPPFTEKELPDQHGKVHIVTGGYSGVGLELVKLLHGAGATVYVAGRSPDKAAQAIEEVKKGGGGGGGNGRVEFLKLDLASLASIKGSVDEFVGREDRLDVLTNNAGVMFPPKGSVSEEGHELQMGTNCLGPFLFTQLLLPLLRKTAASSPPGSVRVTWAASVAIDLLSPAYGVDLDDATGAPKVLGTPQQNYGQSKSGNVLLGTEFARRYREDGIVSSSWNPGNLYTELYRHTGPVERLVARGMLYPAVKGAYTELYAGWSPDITLENSGCLVVPWGRIQTPRAGLEQAIKRKDEGGLGVAEKFWEWCEKETKAYM